MTNLERVAYIRGLAEGLELEADKKEVKVLDAILTLLEDMALSLSDLEQMQEGMAKQLDAVDEDLGLLEGEVYDLDPHDCDCGCDCEEPEASDDEFFYEVTCPTCSETICLSEDVLGQGEMYCPSCKELLELDLDSLDSECGCGESCGCSGGGEAGGCGCH